MKVVDTEARAGRDTVRYISTIQSRQMFGIIRTVLVQGNSGRTGHCGHLDKVGGLQGYQSHVRLQTIDQNAHSGSSSYLSWIQSL